MEPSYLVKDKRLLLSRREFARWWGGGCAHSYINRQAEDGYLPLVGDMIDCRAAWLLLNRRRRSYGRKPYPWPTELDEIFLDLSR